MKSNTRRKKEGGGDRICERAFLKGDQLPRGLANCENQVMGVVPGRCAQGSTQWVGGREMRTLRVLRCADVSNGWKMKDIRSFGK